MLTVAEQDIFLGCSANSKRKALEIAAASLVANGYVTEDYFTSMMDREKALSTYLGSGVAMPHGTKQGQSMVLKTGFQILQFPAGVSWGEGKVACLVVAVAAHNNDHIDVIADLADLFGDEVKTERLRQIKEIKQFLDILHER